MAKYLVDRMIVADSRFNKMISPGLDGYDSVKIVEEVLFESRSDSRYESLKKYSIDAITREHIDILKKRVVNEMIDYGSLLPDEGTGEAMIAAEYWCRDIGIQSSLFDINSDTDKVVVTNDNKALRFFNKNKVHVMKGEEFFQKIKDPSLVSLNSELSDKNKKGIIA